MADPRNLALLRDAGNNVVPQYFDVSTGRFRPVAMEPDAVDSINIRNTNLLKASGGAILTYQYLDISGVWVSYNPRDGSSALPPNLSYVRSVNMLLPDNSGNVNVPIPENEYTFIDVIPPTDPESDYPYGTSAFITYFERATMEDWAAVFDNEDIPDGEMMVVTHRRNNINNYCVQLVDMFKDGRFDAQFSRSWDYGIGDWTPLERITYVQSVNGIEPDVSGNIELPIASGTDLGVVKIDGDTINIDANGVISAVGGGVSGSRWFVSATQPVGGTTIDFWLNSINHFVYTFDGTNWTQTDTNLRGATWFKGEENPPYSLGHIADFYLNTTTYDIFQKHILNWSLIGNIKGADGDPLQIVDEFEVYDATKAMSANKVSELNDFAQNLYTSLIHHMETPADDNYIGHVKPDGTTITVDNDGVISVVGGGSGTPGPQGPKGDPGEDGTKWFAGPYEPAPGEGENGDYWLKTDTGDIYYFGVGGLWNLSNGNLKGPAGDKGDPGEQGIQGDKGDKGDTGATGPQGIPGEDGDPLQIANNLTTTEVGKALDATQGKKLADDLSEHAGNVASTTELGHVKIDGTSVKMHENNQLYVDVGDLPIPIQINNEYILSDSPTTYPVGHTITMLGPDDPGFADLISEFNLDYDIELTTLNTRFIVQTVKNKNSMTHQTAQAITNNRGSVLGTMYRFSQSTYYGFSSWYSQTHVLTGRGAPGDQGRGEGIAGNLYVNSITGKVHAKAGYDKTVGYTNWRLVGPAVVNNTFSPIDDDDEHVFSAYAVNQMITTHVDTTATDEAFGHVKVDGDTIISNDGVISAMQVPGPQGAEGAQGPKGDVGEKGDKGDKGDQGLQGTQGIQGPQGEGFSTVRSYNSIAAMDAAWSTDGIDVGKYVIIANSANGADPDNGKVYVKSSSGYVFVVNMGGSQGVAGPQGLQGVQGAQGPAGPQGPQGVIIPSESRQIKMWTGTTTVSGGNGEWSINYASAGFTEIRSIQITLESGITAAADKPLGGYVASKTLTAASGKAYKVSSAGLLAAMQQVFADNGVTVNVLIIGH